MRIGSSLFLIAVGAILCFAVIATVAGIDIQIVGLILMIIGVIASVVRMLPVAVAMLGTVARRPTLAFLGWFGPRGLASIVFAVILIDDTELPHLRTLLLAITVTIALSVYAHGLTARPLTERYARWFNSHPPDARPAMESVHAAEHRLRIPSRPA